MTKSDLIKKIFEKILENTKDKKNITKTQIEDIFLSLVEVVEETLKMKEKVIVPGLGVFQLKHRKERTCKVPKSEQIVVVPAQDVPTFTVSKKLKNFFKK
ncbi:HU family DNA-binding protein [Candidatus Phytoplasma pini]|uniref:DNA binding protein, histone-like protein n=1 Tax=Candidatus Phytoplasma pini TaxID=267362 RepID=A0A559KJC0_9MOLU|nr:HU family DNA-binding protein [Candidatus Phytoplasma pini]TVY12207.1 DNA binding protein, histone-like protein [Candidatus Phytoplasma pini]